MSAKLTIDDFQLLAAIRSGTAQQVAGHIHSTSSLFVFGLLSRQPSGELLVTKAGERALFQQAALGALADIIADHPAALDGAVRQWLLDAGFIEFQAGGSALRATRPGATWLSSFAVEAPKAPPAIDPADFPRRRNGAH